MLPLLISKVHEQLITARDDGTRTIECSLDLDRTPASVNIRPDGWIWQGKRYPYLENCKPRTVYFWIDNEFQPASRFSNGLIKLVPTEWGAPTFEIDGIKMLPTAQVSPYDDAQRKVALIEPRGKRILDTCGGLGYFAAWCIEGGAASVQSFEKNSDVIWLRGLNPWSPEEGNVLSLTNADIAEHISNMPDGVFDAALHDPPRFGIAGELYSQMFYEQLARVLRPRGRLFHYTGTPNKLTSGRDVPNEVAKRLVNAGFLAELKLDGVLAIKR